MFNCFILETNTSKIAKCWGREPPVPLNLRRWWPEVVWFGQIVVFKLIMTKLNLNNQLWRHWTSS